MALVPTTTAHVSDEALRFEFYQLWGQKPMDQMKMVTQDNVNRLVFYVAETPHDGNPFSYYSREDGRLFSQSDRQTIRISLGDALVIRACYGLGNCLRPFTCEDRKREARIKEFEDMVKALLELHYAMTERCFSLIHQSVRSIRPMSISELFISERVADVLLYFKKRHDAAFTITDAAVRFLGQPQYPSGRPGLYMRKGWMDAKSGLQDKGRPT